MTLVLIGSMSMSTSSFAFSDGSGWANFGYLVKILAENIKRYQQLRMMIDQARDQKNFLKGLHSGLENSIGLLEGIPITDENILNELKNFQKASRKIEEIYGLIPKSQDKEMLRLHDQTIAESLKMVTSFKKFVEIQEKNSQAVSRQARNTSPKGAARMMAETQGMIMKSLAQLIRLQNQSLKMQSEQFALMNKMGKQESYHFEKVHKDIGKGFANFKMSSSFVRF